MKRLLVTLLFLGGPCLKASYFRAAKTLDYYSQLKHEVVQMSQSTPKKVKWFKDAQEGNLAGMREKYYSLATPEEKLLLVNAHDRTGKNALMHAVSYGQPEVTQWLVDVGTDLTKTNHVSLNAVEAAARLIKAYKRTYNRCYSRRGVYEPKKFHKRMVDTAWKHDFHN